MTAQLHQAYGIVDGRAYSDQDRALLRNVELARQKERRTLRLRRHRSA